MKRVLEVYVNPFIQGGAQVFIMNMISHINMDELSIDLFTPYYVDKNLEDFVYQKFDKVYTNLIPFDNGVKGRNYFKALLNVLKNNEYDVVHIHSGRLLTLALASLAAKLEKVPKIIVHSHSGGNKRNVKYLLDKYLKIYYNTNTGGIKIWRLYHLISTARLSVCRARFSL